MAEGSQIPGSEITSDDKLWAALAYIFAPWVPIILLFMEDKKNRPFIRAHNAQALVLGVIALVLVAAAGCGAIIWLVMLYWGLAKALQGEYVEIPVITKWVKSQGWA